MANDLPSCFFPATGEGRAPTGPEDWSSPQEASVAMVASACLSCPKGGWCGSVVVMEDLEELQRAGFLSRSSWRAPEMEGEPHPRPEERVHFISFMKRGLSFPVHRFVRHLLD
ncbi:hypothetical protein ACQ4PT_028130 [Festuca glaucescens]